MTSRMARRWLPVALLLALWGAPAPTALAAPSAISIRPGPGSFTFVDAKGDPSKPMTVYTYLPKGLGADAARIVFVMHGHHQNAVGYRDRWSEHAERHRFMVVVPFFDDKHWGGGEYSYASVRGGKATVRDPSRWSYSVVEHLFDAIRDATRNKSPRYFIYGHSEGGQFVHRLVLLLPEARYVRAVTANSGWYTMPTFGVKYPYGLAGSPVTEASLKGSLGRDVVVLLGDRDTDPDDPDLRQKAPAMAQGKTRLDRGRTFFKEATDRAAELKSGFGWRLELVPGGTHSDGRMGRAGAAALMAR